MAIINPVEIETKDLHQYLLSIVAPRPIAFVSTIDDQGVPNLAPFSFFNCFSSNPPIVVFSANRRVVNGSTKDTLANIEQNRECVIHAVSYDIVRQVAIASCDFPKEIDEFKKTGFTPVAADLVKPFRVKESPAAMECKVTDIIALGSGGGAGNLIICEVLRIHLHDHIINDRHRIEPNEIDLMGRMGRTYYNRAAGESIYSIIQPYSPVPIGYDQLPLFITADPNLSPNDLGALAGLDHLPIADEIIAFSNDPEIKELLSKNDPIAELYHYSRKALFNNDKVNGANAIYLINQLKNG